MTTPFDNLIDWFKALSPKYRQDLISEIVIFLPGIEVNPYHRKYFENFLTEIDTIRKKGIREEYGLFLCLKTLIDHIVVSKNRENAGWEKEKKELDELAQMTGSCSIATHASEKSMQYSQWKAIGEAWQELRARFLGEHAIEQWQHSVSPSSHIV